MSIQIKKIRLGRKRFLKTPPLQNPLEWLSELASLKKFLALETSFQIVGTKVYFEISQDAATVRMMLEVVGVPIQLEQNTLELIDREALEVLVHKLAGRDLFNTDLPELMQTGRKVHKSLETMLKRSDSGILPILRDGFHIVYDNEKIELHFFSQKDYIEK